MKAPEKSINIYFDLQTDICGIDLHRLEEAIRHICDKFALKQADIQIQITDDKGISSVHGQFLNDPSVTDVISFDLTDDAGCCFQLVVNAEMARRKADTFGHSAEAELALYIIHGMLHNLGFDDTEPNAAKKMHETEDSLLQELGFGIIYMKNETTD
jgi:probable rRNA maturation factor